MKYNELLLQNSMVIKLIRSLFGAKKERIDLDDSQQSPDFLLRKATSLKEAGNIDEAIETLRQAFSLMQNYTMEYSIKTYLRLPLYLQQAGRNDEAWREFNYLLTNKYGSLSQNSQLVPMNHSTIYDKMRLSLQREKKFDLAVRFGILSYLCWMQGLKIQKRIEEFKDLSEKENIEDELCKLLKKTKKMELQPKLFDVMIKYIKQLPNLNVGEFSSELDKIIFNKLRNM